MIKKVGDIWKLDKMIGGRSGVRYRKNFSKKTDALAYERFLIKNTDKNGFLASHLKDNCLLSELIDLWFKHVGFNLSSGEDTYARLLKASMAMGDCPIDKLTASHFIDYRSRRIDAGILPQTINRELATFNAAFRSLNLLGYIAIKSPFLLIQKIRTHQPKTTYLTSEQIILLLGNLKNNEDAYLITLICLSTGARWGEAQSINFSDLGNSSITYNQTKSKKSRTIPIQGGLFHLLSERLKRGSFVDCYSTFSRRLDESGIVLPAGQRTHVLRHTFASHFMMNGGNIISLQNILGHSSLQMTMRYSHLAPDFLKEVIEKNPVLSFC